jgi:hypothetical protein
MKNRQIDIKQSKKRKGKKKLEALKGNHEVLFLIFF